MLDVVVKILWLCLAGFLGQDWFHALFFSLRNPLEIVLLLLTPYIGLRVEPISDRHAGLAHKHFPLATLDDLLAPPAGQLLTAQLENIPLLRGALFP